MREFQRKIMERETTHPPFKSLLEAALPLSKDVTNRIKPDFVDLFGEFSTKKKLQNFIYVNEVGPDMESNLFHWRTILASMPPDESPSIVTTFPEDTKEEELPEAIVAFLKKHDPAIITKLIIYEVRQDLLCVTGIRGILVGEYLRRTEALIAKARPTGRPCFEAGEDAFKRAGIDGATGTADRFTNATAGLLRRLKSYK